MNNKLVENFPNMAEIMESNFDFKFDSGHLEQMSSVFKEIFAQLHEIKPIVMFQYIHSKLWMPVSLSKLQTLFLKHVERLEPEIFEL